MITDNPPIPITLPLTQTTADTSSFEEAKKKCEEIGLKSGTESFGNCVMKLSK